MVFGRILLLKANVFWVARTNRKFSAVYNLKKLEYCLVLVTRILTPNPKKWSQYDMQAPKVLDFLEKLISKFFNFDILFIFFNKKTHKRNQIFQDSKFARSMSNFLLK
jgi:hypothetical protein